MKHGAVHSGASSTAPGHAPLGLQTARQVKIARGLAILLGLAGIFSSVPLLMEQPPAGQLPTVLPVALNWAAAAALWLLARQLADLEQQARLALAQSELRRHCLLAASPVAIVRVDAANTPIEWNQQLPGLWGKPLPVSDTAVLSQQDWQTALPRLIEAARAAPADTLLDYTIFCSNGAEARLELHLVPCCAIAPASTADQQAWIFIRDVTQQREDEFYMRLSRQALESISEGILITDASSRIVHVNPGFEKLTGYSEKEIIGLRPSILKSAHQSADFFKAMWHDLNAQGHWDGELWNRRKDGQSLPCRMHIDALHDAQGAITHYVGVFSDISAQKQVEARFSYLAHHDALTDLPNRLALHALLPQTLALARREGYRIAVCYIDLDGFKQVNDEFGHQAGDVLLVEMSRRLKQCVRASDTLARIGGDEFIVIIHQVGDRTDVERVMHTLARALPQPITIKEGVQIMCTPSIGIALFPDHGSNQDELLNRADRAMYAVKSAGKSGYAFYDPTQPGQHGRIAYWHAGEPQA